MKIAILIRCVTFKQREPIDLRSNNFRNVIRNSIVDPYHSFAGLRVPINVLACLPIDVNAAVAGHAQAANMDRALVCKKYRQRHLGFVLSRIEVFVFSEYGEFALWGRMRAAPTKSVEVIITPAAQPLAQPELKRGLAGRPPAAADLEHRGNETYDPMPAKANAIHNSQATPSDHQELSH
jgi:hypothetical protein